MTHPSVGLLIVLLILTSSASAQPTRPSVLFQFVPTPAIVVTVGAVQQVPDPEAFVMQVACVYLANTPMTLPVPFTIRWMRFAPGGAEVFDEQRALVRGTLTHCQPPGRFQEL